MENRMPWKTECHRKQNAYCRYFYRLKQGTGPQYMLDKIDNYELC